MLRIQQKLSLTPVSSSGMLHHYVHDKRNPPDRMGSVVDLDLRKSRRDRNAQCG